MGKLRHLHLWLMMGFLLGIHNGYVALWKDGNPQPQVVFPYQARMLPVQDQQELAGGIAVPDEAQLQQLLEDYLS